jgi:hypothetical protein
MSGWPFFIFVCRFCKETSVEIEAVVSLALRQNAMRVENGGFIGLIWGRMALFGTVSSVYASGTPYTFNPSNLSAFSLRISGRTSSRIGIFSKSASQRSGVING